jgi:hypothetical protein
VNAVINSGNFHRKIPKISKMPAVFMSGQKKVNMDHSGINPEWSSAEDWVPLKNLGGRLPSEWGYFQMRVNWSNQTPIRCDSEGVSLIGEQTPSADTITPKFSVSDPNTYVQCGGYLNGAEVVPGSIDCKTDP